MRKLITLLLLAVSVQLFAQSYPITSITISLPANPDANTANWGTGTSLFMISATAKGMNGRVEPSTVESKILVIIKKGGSKMYGAYTSGTAPSANFTTLTKVWNGSNATSLIGKDYTLPPGDYELSVQFFGNGAAGVTPLSDEKIKAFTIKGTEQQAYQAPQAIMPANGTLFKESDIQKPVTFRWTPVVPKPQEPITYRLKVWQLMQGQSGSQAMRANQPIITKDVDNLTQATVNNIITGPCKPPYLCDFVWNVQALNREGKPIGSNNGTSELFAFSAANGGCQVSYDVVMDKINCIGKDSVELCAKLICNKSGYGPSNGYTPYPTIITGVSVLDQNFAIVLPPYSIGNPTVTEGNTFSFCVRVKINSSISQLFIRFDVKVDVPNRNCVNQADGPLVVPNCDPPCDCGTWGKLQITNSPINNIECGRPIDLVCNKEFKFSNTYQCSPSNASCMATTKWVITKNGVGVDSGNGLSGIFVPTQGGVYSLTLRATCNGKICPPCTYRLVVACPPACDCGTWSGFKFQNAAGSIIVGCGKEATWKCNQLYNFSNAYTCNPNNANCVANINWTVTKGGVNIANGTGANGSFTPTQSGNYTITYKVKCGDKICDSCVNTIKVDCPPPCDCGTWGKLQIANSPVNNIECGRPIDLVCNKEFKFSNTYQCSPSNASCVATTKWVITKNGVGVDSGNGLSGIFVPTQGGVYSLTLQASCNGKICPPCTYRLVVPSCPPLCDCGTWGNLIVQNAPLRAYKCGSEIAWKCSQEFKFSNTLTCSPNDASCVAKTEWVIAKDGQPYTNGNGLNGSFTPTTNGVYTITLKASCNGKECSPCEYKVVVKDCPPPCACGTWGRLKIEGSPTSGLDCGKEITWKCKRDFNFSNTFACLPNDASCVAETKWTISKNNMIIGSGNGTAGSFVFTANGTYTLTMQAKCNGKECPPCSYIIYINDCIPPCECGTWGKFVVTDCNNKKEVACGGRITQSCNSTITFTNTFSCGNTSPTCVAKTDWKVEQNGIIISSGSGLVGALTFTSNGIYTITLNAECNGKKCEPCKFIVSVTDCR